ncbi:hypothetical protein ColLi_06658 [Colletotrichum liriopes]|uniref:Uncharacterized protein n=1 Tax=Colletotrichum liriopes TaxID=708192 RepID=A0AA37GND3_9PEZI|nr:hypothetical protein ColLi_06658 [Colletotrichum liriopes]
MPARDPDPDSCSPKFEPCPDVASRLAEKACPRAKKPNAHSVAAISSQGLLDMLNYAILASALLDSPTGVHGTIPGMGSTSSMAGLVSAFPRLWASQQVVSGRGHPRRSRL